jgi:hypothetical protein
VVVSVSVVAVEDVLVTDVVVGLQRPQDLSQSPAFSHVSQKKDEQAKDSLPSKNEQNSSPNLLML